MFALSAPEMLGFFTAIAYGIPVAGLLFLISGLSASLEYRKKNTTATTEKMERKSQPLRVAIITITGLFVLGLLALSLLPHLQAGYEGYQNRKYQNEIDQTRNSAQDDYITPEDFGY